mmetsp:Transcript_49605/g.105407  ORF Transcript_49605/g.105407 Transcript_49605/m.105407 type:complete len:88 (+) Transcript_49605:152-415(+)
MNEVVTPKRKFPPHLVSDRSVLKEVLHKNKISQPPLSRPTVAKAVESHIYRIVEDRTHSFRPTESNHLYRIVKDRTRSSLGQNRKEG